MQGRVASALGLRAVFEPLGVNHLALPTFQKANQLFRVGVRQPELACSGSPGEWAQCADQWESQDGETHRALRSHLEAMHAAVGRSVVWKEIRLLYAVPLVMEVYAQMGLNPRVLLVRCDPLSVLYSFYRMVALGSSGAPFGRSLDGFFENRLALYQARWGDPKLPLSGVANPSQRVLAGALLDLQAMEHLEVEYRDQVHCVELGCTQDALSRVLGREASGAGERPPAVVRGPAWAGDPLFRKSLRSRLGEGLYQEVESAIHGRGTDLGRPNLRQRVTEFINWMC